MSEEGNLSLLILQVGEGKVGSGRHGRLVGTYRYDVL
jgi:hypothetical protein